MDDRKILPPRSSGSRAEPTPYPSIKPDLAASVPSEHDRSHQPASTLPSPQGLGHSIYQPTPGSSRRLSFTTSITYGADAGTEGGFPSPLRPIKPEEIRAARPSPAVSPPGPDGLTARQFRDIPVGIIVRIFNSFSGARICPNTW